ncbi:MAG: very short patch repair endonuclease [Tannerella sp.]|jgi:DNA mismatch endonuclease (patch repair protein)|nr:very short patch repair endonuclease [Tannerella sp.]
MDKFTTEKRSEIMSHISGKETKPEISVRKFLFGHGFRYRKNNAALPGKPDIVLSKYKTVIFVNGCFWHGHRNCKKAELPVTNRAFWQEKVEGNKRRDVRQIEELEEMGYRVITLWQCELTSKFREKTLDNLLKSITS